MAKLTSPKAVEAWEKMMQWSEEMQYQDEVPMFLKDVDALIREVQNETELALMRGETRHLGEKHMLLTALYQALALCSRPIQREAAFTIVKEGLDKYLGVGFPGQRGKRPRRSLLPHV